QEFLQGLKITFMNKVIATILLVALVLNAATATLQMLITMWAYDVLHLGSVGYGFLLTALLVGTWMGSLLAGSSVVKRIYAPVLLASSTIMFGGLFALLPMFEHVVVSASVNGQFEFVTSGQTNRQVSPCIRLTFPPSFGNFHREM
ncbi:MAG: hypothetical protein ACXW02_08475, partial [Halobacteriota archaeon]